MSKVKEPKVEMVRIVNKMGIEKVIPLYLAINMRKQRDIESWETLDTKENIIVTDAELKAAEAELHESIAELRNAYKEAFDKPVPNNKGNDAEWIVKQLKASVKGKSIFSKIFG